MWIEIRPPGAGVAIRATAAFEVAEISGPSIGGRRKRKSKGMCPRASLLKVTRRPAFSAKRSSSKSRFGSISSERFLSPGSENVQRLMRASRSLYEICLGARPQIDPDSFLQLAENRCALRDPNPARRGREMPFPPGPGSAALLLFIKTQFSNFVQKQDSFIRSAKQKPGAILHERLLERSASRARTAQTWRRPHVQSRNSTSTKDPSTARRFFFQFVDSFLPSRATVCRHPSDP